MRAALLASAMLLVATPAAAVAAERAPARFEIGADLSSLPAVEAAGGVFRDSAGATDAIALLRAAGFTAVRLRVWHSPRDRECGPAAALGMARRVHEAGMRLLLDLHYSDTWADPGHQSPPAAWTGLAIPVLADSVREWTRSTLAAFGAQGTPPDLVQVGNEIDHGFLWEAGRISGAGDPAPGFCRLLAAAAAGVRAGAPHARVMVHLAAGTDRRACRAMLARLRRAGIAFDAIGLSYYPWWHGTPEALAANVADLARRERREVQVVETAYPWTTEWRDDVHDVVGPGTRLLPGDAATPEGQAAFAAELRRVVVGAGGAGLWWWEPAWITAPGRGSPWENCGLVGADGRLLPAARALAH